MRRPADGIFVLGAPDAETVRTLAGSTPAGECPGRPRRTTRVRVRRGGSRPYQRGILHRRVSVWAGSASRPCTAGEGHDDHSGVDEEVVRHLVDRREARRRGADIVRFIGARTEEGEVASWTDLYMDPAAGIAQIEDLVTSEAHLRRGHAEAVLTTALRQAVDGDCGTRFLTADATDWPRHWYERRGFSGIGHFHCFERG
ncbi:GNAT family N-acetyltransferase [Streptomyces sp. NPDC058620]|uniref:GNAT family N-acetyltransferase n=1 Tax=Streptomyces sp. NPDC058620 TaxID=3346560 RepID=UPI00365B20AD